MINPKDFLKAGQQLHGHKCPAMPQGLRAGAAAMNKLGVERAKVSELIALVELGDHHCAHCFADGVQMITGCTFGKGNIKQLNYGKFGLTLIDKATGRSVRVVPKADVQMQSKKTKFFTEYRMKGIPASKVPPEFIEPLIDKVMNMPEDQLLNISEITPYELPKHPDVYSSFVCEECGDMVVESYARVFEGRKVCIPCQEKLLMKNAK